MVSVLFGAMPTEAGGIELNTDIATSHSVCAQVSTALSESAHIRLMGFMNTTTALSFSQNQAIQIQSSDPISNKFGLCLDADQKLNERWALFERLSWNDGQSESMSLTETNRSYCVGAHLERGLLDMDGHDCGAAFVLSQLSDEHVAYHQLGGESFVLSDISKYGAEVLMEAYYRFALNQHLQLTFDAQYVVNPGFERGNRPLRLLASRLSFIL